MGESQNQPFQLSFNRILGFDFQGSRLTSDGGLLLVCELDERLGLRGLIQNHLVDSHTGAFWQHAEKDRGATIATRIGELQTGTDLVAE